MAAGFQSLAKGASRHFAAGAVRQTMVEMEQAYLFVTAAGQGAWRWRRKGRDKVVTELPGSLVAGSVGAVPGDIALSEGVAAQ